MIYLWCANHRKTFGRDTKCFHFTFIFHRCRFIYLFIYSFSISYFHFHFSFVHSVLSSCVRVFDESCFYVCVCVCECECVSADPIRTNTCTHKKKSYSSIDNAILVYFVRPPQSPFRVSNTLIDICCCQCFVVQCVVLVLSYSLHFFCPVSL